jgi:hypothetical protein
MARLTVTQAQLSRRANWFAVKAIKVTSVVFTTFGTTLSSRCTRNTFCALANCLFLLAFSQLNAKMASLYCD